MSSLRKQRKSFDPNNNPFIKANNPYRIAEKFYTQSSSQEKFSNKSSYKNLKNSCNHCVKNSTFLDQLNKKPTVFKEEKQNIQKISSLKFRAARATQNPFQRKRLIIQDSNINKNQQARYSGTDEQNLLSLLESNPFRKYEQQRGNYDKNNDIEVQFHQIKMLAMPNLINDDSMNNKTSLKEKIQNNLLRYGTVRFSIDSLNSNKYKIDSIQNSPTKKGKMSPTFANIQTHRRSSTSSSQQNLIRGMIDQNYGLMKQISRSRKELLQFSTKRSAKQAQNNLITQDKIQQILQKLDFQDNQNKILSSIVVKGRKFFLNQVIKKY